MTATQRGYRPYASCRRSSRANLRFHRLFNGIEEHGQRIGAWCSVCNATIGDSNASRGDFDAVECARAAVQSSEFATWSTSGPALTCPEYVSHPYVSM